MVFCFEGLKLTFLAGVFFFCCRFLFGHYEFPLGAKIHITGISARSLLKVFFLAFDGVSKM